MAYISSSRDIHDIHCFPLPIGPPAPILNGSSIFPRAPPVPERTMPDLRYTCLTSSGRFADASSQSEQTSGRKPSPIALSSVSSSSPRSPYQPIALATMKTSGFFFIFAIASESRAVLSTLEFRMALFLFLLHLLSPIPSPPRWMMESKPSRIPPSSCPTAGSQKSSFLPSWGLLLTSLQTSWPPVSRKATSWVPIIPDEPATRIFLRGESPNFE